MIPTQVFAKSIPGTWPTPTAQRLQPITEPLCGWVKPREGGLWSSSLLEDGTSGWIRWCLSESYAGPEFDLWHLTPAPDAKVYTIGTHADLTALAERFPPRCDHDRPCRDWGLAGSGLSWRRVAEVYDGVRVTDDGQWATRLSHPHNLYGWDCEATVWFRWAFSRVEHVGHRTFDPETVR